MFIPKTLSFEAFFKLKQILKERALFQRSLLNSNAALAVIQNNKKEEDVWNAIEIFEKRHKGMNKFL